MSELLTSAQMRAIEAAAIDSGAVTGLELMERAGRGVVEAIMAHWPHLAKSSYRAVVLCGPGNNGGDGFVIARLLRQSGWEVTVFLYGDAAKLPPDARANFERWSAMGEVLPLSECAFRTGGRNIADLYIDAVFGTGLSRAPDGELAQVLRHLGGAGGDDYASQMVSVDAPSGLCLDSGRILSAYPNGAGAFEVRFAALTVTFQSAKAGHHLADGPAACGELVVKDIGLGAATPAPHQSVRLAAAPHPAILSKTSDRHKYSFGHALVLCGPSGKTGAARLAARGALRIGAGLVTLGVPKAAIPEVAAQVTSVMTLPIDSPEDLHAALTDRRINAICLGPGLGVERAAALVPVALAARRRMVLDADALTALSQNPDLMGLLHEDCILTPHAGEFARLFPEIAAKLSAPAVSGPAYSKVDATRDAAAAAGCTVLFKGADTVIADPNGRAILASAQYDRAAPWLATAGSGDVLAGFITGLLARGGAVSTCAEIAATLHVDCARRFGAGLIAEDLPEQLPQVMRALGLT